MKTVRKTGKLVAVLLLATGFASAQAASEKGQGWARVRRSAGEPGGVLGGVAGGVPGGVEAGVLAGIPGGVAGPRLAGQLGLRADAAEFGGEQSREEELYERGQEALDERRWERAADAFDRVAQMKGKRADAALYWQAYALHKLGRSEQALTVLRTMMQTFPQSRWLSDAKALEVEIRRTIGQPVSPEGESDCDLKLMAIHALMHAGSERAVPMLEKVLHGVDCPQARDRALFVLAQSSSPQARQILVRIARGEANPDLQRRAIRYLGIHGGSESRKALREIYAATSDVDVKRAILSSFMVAGERGHLLQAARSEPNADVRADAISQLGAMGAQAELWQLYQGETSVELKKIILNALFVGGSVDRLLEVAHKEKDRELRRAAIYNLGLSGSKRTGDMLASLYPGASDMEISKAVIQALFVQNNATALVAIARKESNAELKKELVQKLSMMRSKEAMDYLLEILNK